MFREGKQIFPHAVYLLLMMSIYEDKLVSEADEMMKVRATTALHIFCLPTTSILCSVMHEIKFSVVNGGDF